MIFLNAEKFLRKYVNDNKNNVNVLSNNMRKQLLRIEKMLDNPLYTFDSDKAVMAVEFIETFCKHFEGTFAGKPFLLEDWQKLIIYVTFGFYWKGTSKRVVKETFVLVGRKNGKSSLLAGIALYMLIADGEQAPQVVTCATKKEQARILFNMAYKMVQFSPHLSKVITKRRTDLEATINSGVLKPLSRDANSLDGLNVHLGIFDEVHAYKDSDLIDVIQSSQGSRENPLLFMITTNGTVRESVFDDRYQYYVNILNGEIEDDTVQPFLYELDSANEINDVDKWIKANPNLGVSLSTDYLKEQVKRALDDPKQKVGVLTKHFNIPQTSDAVFFSADECKRREFDESILKGSIGFVGVDMAYTTDFACITYMTKIDGNFYTKRWFLKPESRIVEHSKKDGIDYTQLNEVVAMKGDTLNQKDVYDWMIATLTNIGVVVKKFAVDPYRADYIIATLRDTYYKEYCVAVSDNYRKAFTPTAYHLKSHLSEGRWYFNEKLQSIHFAGTGINIGRDDTINFIKIKSNGRIDGSVASVYVLKAYELYCEENQIPM